MPQRACVKNFAISFSIIIVFCPLFARAWSRILLFKSFITLYYKRMTVSQLRQQFPTFTYRSYDYQLTSEGLHLEFWFELDTQHQFHPSLDIYDIQRDDLERIPLTLLEQYVFHLGLVEMLSYWKTTCSPEIIIQAGALDATQLAWWHRLIMHGLGEFFFVNQIEFTAPDFVNLTSLETPPSSKAELQQPPTPELPRDARILIPIGGGKDSVATLELLKAWSSFTPQLSALHLNPAQANQETADISGIPHQHYVERHLDPLLGEMNSDGFLNGHTPFSALMAFLSTFVAHLTGYQAIAVSNERSSNEGNVEFLGRDINHQYSKSFAFEQDFQAYMATYFTDAPWYFSLLRPWYELQIARYFAQYPEYHSAFRSCNRGKKTNAWCGECSKCLFAYIILLPFIGEKHLISIFGQNVLANLKLLPIARELVGYAPQKPLECVGTKEESLVAVYLCLQWYIDHQQALPPLLQTVADTVLIHEQNLAQRADKLLSSWNHHHAVPVALQHIMEKYSHA